MSTIELDETRGHVSSKPFIHEEFLLETRHARRLFHEYAAELPIIDYHCHLPPDQVAEDKRFRNMAEIWLGGDHYKWRAMRANGVDERFITGDATDWEKFEKWAETVPHTLRNPLYHWTHFELRRPFGIDDRLFGPDTAREIWDECNAKLALPQFSARGIMRQMKVVLVCTTDDPGDSLEHHRKIAADATFEIKVLPTWRPDKSIAVEDAKTYNAYLDQLAQVAGIEIKAWDDLMSALGRRHDFFHQLGCRISDHGLETFYADETTAADTRKIFAQIRAGKKLKPAEISAFKSAMLYEFGLMDHAKGWVQQYHVGAMRNNNSRMFERVGPDAGYDSIGTFDYARQLSRFLDRLENEGRLAKTILYNLNPCDNDMIATMIGNFQGEGIPGKIQMGSGWWFMDQLDGMARQIESLSQCGLLSRFVGMLTDSRSFLSYTRHDYFRRLLCNILGNDMQRGLIPEDYDLVGDMVRNISYRNARNYFGFDLAED